MQTHPLVMPERFIKPRTGSLTDALIRNVKRHGLTMRMLKRENGIAAGRMYRLEQKSFGSLEFQNGGSWIG